MSLPEYEGGEWVEVTEENILKYDMVRLSGMTPEFFIIAIDVAIKEGHIPKMWIPNE